MMALCQDIKYSLRMLRKNPGFTVVAILTLALGIGACATTFSLVNAVVLRPLPFRKSGRLVWFENWASQTLSERTSRVDNFLDWRDQTQSFEDLAAFNAFFGRYVLTDGGEPRRLRGVQVSQNFFSTLGVRPLLGRNFVPEECVPGGPPAVMLSHAFWQQRFAGAPDAIGRTMTLNGKSVPIVGVLPPKTHLDVVFSSGSNIELLLPLSLTGEILQWGNTIFAMGRLKPDVTLVQAQEEMAVIHARVVAAHPERADFSPETGPTLIALDNHVRGAFRPAFLLLSIAVLLVWLIACINLSNLLLARADARHAEFSVRSALGARRWRLLRQTLTESLVIAGAGSGFGVLAAFFGVALLAKLQVFGIPLLQTAAIDGQTLTIAVAMAFASALLCSALPSLQLWHQDLIEALNASGTRGNTSLRGAWVRQTLVVSEISFACILLVGAGLLTRSFLKVLQVDLGFQAERIISWRVDRNRPFVSALAHEAYYDALVERVSRLPGVSSVGISDFVPLGYRRHWPLDAQGVTYQSGEPRGGYVRIVDQRLLQTLRVPLLQGRYFNDSDTRNSEKVVIISETLARNTWKGRNPIGQTALINSGWEFTVVGVVADVAHGLEDTPRPDFYLDFRQLEIVYMDSPQLVVRTTESKVSMVPGIREAIQDFDATLASNEFTFLEQIVDDAIAPRRLITGILNAFSSFALLLAALGLYGVIAYSVGRRTREIGIRMALGAQRSSVLWFVLRDTLRMTGIGMAIGLTGALLGSRILQNQLFGITSSDPMTYIVTVAVLGAVTLTAAWLPAHRAAKTDPLKALRYE